VKFQAAFEAQPKWVIAVAMASLVAGIGMADYLTSWEVSLFIFYGIPIFLGAWQAGRRVGFALAVLAGLVQCLANLPTHPYLTQGGYVWAAINRLFYFGFVAVGGAAMRRQREQSREHIAALTLARNLELEIIRAGEREQIRIGQDLHDGVCQSLAAIDCATACLKEDLEVDGLPQAATAGIIQKFLKDTIVEARNLARGIFPVQVENDGLASALNELATKANFIREGSVRFESSGDIEIEDMKVAVHLYRIAQEAMSNASRHANASSITLGLSQEGRNLVLTISDNGSGFKVSGNPVDGIGLRTMRHRAQLIGASIAILSEPGRGTIVECVLPIPVPKSSETLVSHSA
jgi:signal transduction histidine kinase